MNVLAGITESPEFRLPTLRRYMAGAAAGLALAGAAVAVRSGHSETLNPNRKANVISRISEFPNTYRLMLEQCGFDLAAPEARGPRNCVDQSYDVNQADYDHYQVGAEVQPGRLHQP